MNEVITKLKIRYSATDAMGIAYHGNYPSFLEVGREDFIERLGLNYVEMENAGFLSPLTDIQISYKKPLHYAETAIIKTWVEELTPVSTTYMYEIYNDKNELCVTASSKHVVVNKENFRPISLKRKFPDWYQKYEDYINSRTLNS